MLGSVDHRPTYPDSPSPSGQRGCRSPISPSCGTERTRSRTPSAIFQTVSEGEFSEVRLNGVLGSSSDKGLEVGATRYAPSRVLLKVKVPARSAMQHIPGTARPARRRCRFAPRRRSRPKRRTGPPRASAPPTDRERTPGNERPPPQCRALRTRSPAHFGPFFPLGRLGGLLRRLYAVST